MLPAQAMLVLQVANELVEATKTFRKSKAAVGFQAVENRRLVLLLVAKPVSAAAESRIAAFISA